MATYNITALAGAIVKEDLNNVIGQATPSSHLRVWNVLAQSGLVVGDVIQIVVPVPAWARSVWLSKATDTSNADIFSASYADASGSITALPPLGIGAGIVSPAFSTAASNSVHFMFPALASHLRIQLSIVTSVPAACRIWLAFRDT